MTDILMRPVVWLQVTVAELREREDGRRRSSTQSCSASWRSPSSSHSSSSGTSAGPVLGRGQQRFERRTRRRKCAQVARRLRATGKARSAPARPPGAGRRRRLPRARAGADASSGRFRPRLPTTVRRSHGSCPSYGDQLDLDDELRGRAIKSGLRAANQTLRNVKSAWIKEQQVRLEGGAIAEYQVNMLVTFVLGDWRPAPCSGDERAELVCRYGLRGPDEVTRRVDPVHTSQSRNPRGFPSSTAATTPLRLGSTHSARVVSSRESTSPTAS